jgi:hypothetical protein
MARFEEDEDRPRRRSRRDEEPPKRRRRPRDEDEVEEDEEEEDEEPWPRRSIRMIDSRVYVHDDCDGETVISGFDFTRVANPFAFVSQTLCAACGRYAGLGRFSWADTGENIRAYRRRLRRQAPLSLKLCCYLFAPLLGTVLAALIGVLITEPLKGIIVGASAGAMIVLLLIAPLIARLWGIDYRQLR